MKIIDLKWICWYLKEYLQVMTQVYFLKMLKEKSEKFLHVIKILSV